MCRILGILLFGRLELLVEAKHRNVVPVNVRKQCAGLSGCEEFGQGGEFQVGPDSLAPSIQNHSDGMTLGMLGSEWVGAEHDCTDDTFRRGLFGKEYGHITAVIYVRRRIPNDLLRGRCVVLATRRYTLKCLYWSPGLDPL